MQHDLERQDQWKAPIVPLSLYLRRRGDGPPGDPFPPAPKPAAARQPPTPVCVEAISAQAGAASHLAAAARAA